MTGNYIAHQHSPIFAFKNKIKKIYREFELNLTINQRINIKQ